MIGLGSKIYYNQDGVDWLRTIVRTVYWYHGLDALFVVSIAARRAQRLYYRKTDIRRLYEEARHE